MAYKGQQQLIFSFKNIMVKQNGFDIQLKTSIISINKPIILQHSMGMKFFQIPRIESTWGLDPCKW